MSKCLVDGCESSVKSYGMCGMHCKRWKRNPVKYNYIPIDSLTPREERTAIKKEWLLNAIQFNYGGCLIWPFSVMKHGYGVVCGFDFSDRVSRVVCQLVYGDPPEGKNDHAHSCGNKLCINPAHIRWASHKENEEDKIKHDRLTIGIKNGMAKLTENEVVKIFHDKRRQHLIAKDYNISQSQVSGIKQRKTYRNVDVGIAC